MSLAMAADPQAVSVFVVATEEAEVHGVSVQSLHTALHVQVSRVIRCAFGVWYREPDYSPLAHQFVTLCCLVCGSADVARRHASRTSSLVTVLVTH